MLSYNRKLIPLARQLRKNMPASEVMIWSRLRMKQLKGYLFYRQKPIGNYIVDFYCPQVKIIIEIDGDQHFTRGKSKKDSERDEYLKNCGLKVLRFNNYDVMRNIDGVIERIGLELDISNPP